VAGADRWLALRAEVDVAGRETVKWLVADSLACPEQFFCSHMSSYSHYLAEAGEQVDYLEVGNHWGRQATGRITSYPLRGDVVFALDDYDSVYRATNDFAVHIAQVAAITNPLPWNVRKADGSPAYSLVISSLQWMVEEARKHGCRAEYMPLAFDTRARVAGMGVARDLDCIFIGSRGPNHQRREQLLTELSDIVTVLPPVFGREYFKTLARAKVVFNVHAEWAKGEANAMRLFEATGMGARVVSDGLRPTGDAYPHRPFHTSERAREEIATSLCDSYELPLCHRAVLQKDTYESRIPRLIELAKEVSHFRR
jgi:hypothetical protein